MTENRTAHGGFDHGSSRHGSTGRVSATRVGLVSSFVLAALALAAPTFGQLQPCQPMEGTRADTLRSFSRLRAAVDAEARDERVVLEAFLYPGDDGPEQALLLTLSESRAGIVRLEATRSVFAARRHSGRLRISRTQVPIPVDFAQLLVLYSRSAIDSVAYPAEERYVSHLSTTPSLSIVDRLWASGPRCGALELPNDDPTLFSIWRDIFHKIPAVAASSSAESWVESLATRVSETMPK